MTLTPSEIDALSDYTDSQMLKLVRWAIATLLSNPDQSVQMAGRAWTSQDLDKLRAMETHYQTRVNAAAAASSAATYGCPVVRFQEPQ